MQGNRGSPPLQMEVEADNRVGSLEVQGGVRLLIWRLGRTEYYGNSSVCRIDSRSKRLTLGEFTDKQDERHVGLVLTIFSWKVGIGPKGWVSCLHELRVFSTWSQRFQGTRLREYRTLWSYVFWNIILVLLSPGEWSLSQWREVFWGEVIEDTHLGIQHLAQGSVSPSP